MSMRSLILDRVDLTARGMIAAAYRRGQQQLSPGVLSRIGDEIISGRQGINWRDKGNVRKIVADQDRAVRAGRRVNDPSVGWVDGRSVPVTNRNPADFAGRRFRATVVVDVVDPVTGLVTESLFHFRSDTRVTFADIQRAVLEGIGGPEFEQYDQRSGLPARSSAINAIRVISVERAF